jgi:hypothetical protein
MAVAQGRPALCPGSVPAYAVCVRYQFGCGVADREAASDAVVLEVGVLPQVGVARLIAGSGICIYDACVDKCVAVLDQAVPAEPPSLPEWVSMWDDELLERIPSTSATNIEAGLRDRVRELRDRGMSCARVGAFLTDELARRVRRQSGSVKGPVEGDALILLHGNPVGMQLTVRNVGRVHNYRCSTCVASVRSAGGRGERLVRGQALAEAA